MGRIWTIVSTSWARARSLSRAAAPGDRAWVGAAWGLFAATLLLLATRFFYNAGATPVLALVLGLPFDLVLAVLFGGLFLLLVRLVGGFPARYRAALTGAFVLLSTQVFGGSLAEKLVPTLFVILAASLAGGGLASLLARSRSGDAPAGSRTPGLVSLVVGVGALTYGVAWLLAAGPDNEPVVDAAAASKITVPAIDLPDPGAPGTYAVRSLTYGSGHNRRRPEYGAGVALVTKPFDGSSFVQGWSGLEALARTRYWGFGPDAMPLNALVWYPDGAGPFPLVLVVHGNHRMQESSEPGYAYLGENLASHGYIVASVDENFLNGGPWNDLGILGVQALSGDNAARGVLLLEHLAAFRAWNAEEGNPFQGKVDLGKIALIGHSRGGEAIAIAAAFNRLSRSPDDASVAFHYGFGIRSLVAIATTDRQYLPAGAPLSLAGVSFLAIQGSNDADAPPGFAGMQQWNRVEFAEGQLAAGVFIHRASHGQFNSVWGQHDKSSFTKSLFFNRRPLLPERDQERAACVFITAFLEATLRAKAGYLPLFADYRAGAKWLPNTIYLNRSREAKLRRVASFDEDVDLDTTTLPGGAIQGENLTVWREQPPGPPSLWDTLGTRSVYLGWDDQGPEKVASYAITLPPGGLGLGPGSVLSFALADGNENPNPHGRRRGPRKAAPAGARQPIDLTIELVDGAGQVARSPLGAVSLLQPQIRTTIWKGWFSEKRPSGVVFKTFELPLALFVAANPRLDPASVKAVRLVFDRTPAGVVVLDDLGFKP